MSKPSGSSTEPHSSTHLHQPPGRNKSPRTFISKNNGLAMSVPHLSDDLPSTTIGRSGLSIPT